MQKPFNIKLKIPSPDILQKYPENPVPIDHPAVLFKSVIVRMTHWILQIKIGFKILFDLIQS